MRVPPSLFVSAFLTDASLYLVFAAIPFRALALGAGPVALGAIPGLYALAYMASASRAGRLSDRVPRLRMAAAAAIAAMACIVAVAAAPSLALLFAALPPLGISLGFFWSPLQAAVSDRVEPRDLGRALGMFNASWTLGKGAGLVLGGLVTAAASPRVVLLLAALPLLGTVLLLARRHPGAAPASAEPVAVDAVPARVVRLAWMTNALAYGFVGTVNMHGPRWLLAQGVGPAAFGALLGAVFGVQVLVFLRSHDRRVTPPLLLVSLASALVALVILVTAHGPMRAAAALPFGLATGLAYHASLRASVDRPHGRGRAAGLHEAILGAGSTSVPLLGGWAAAATGSLSAPFLVAAACLAAGLGIVAISRVRTSP